MADYFLLRGQLRQATLMGRKGGGCVRSDLNLFDWDRVSRLVDVPAVYPCQAASQ
jgi:hypothetical protein